MIRRCRATLIALLLAAAGLAPALASEAVSPAEQQVFSAPHLASLPATATLRYAYSKVETGKAAIEDEAVLNTHREAERGRVVHVDYLHGERQLDLPEVDQAVNNPVILYFLESDVRAMHQRLGGQENYFRRRIRLAFAEAAKVQTVDFDYGGKKLKGTEVVVKPYAGDPLKDRFKGLDGKSYRFVLSSDVPGGVYQLRTVVDDPAGSGKPPLVEESLTLRSGDKAGAH